MSEAIQLWDGIELLSGARMDYLHPENSDATIEDIGHALSNVCRFSGHLPRFYSVAQHAVNVSRVLEANGYSPQVQFTGLMHDTAEAFTNDLPTPLKSAFPVFKELEVKIETAMASRFGFEFPLPASVKLADLILLGLEKEHVKKNTSEWAMLQGLDYNLWKPHVDLSRMTPDRAYDQFMSRFRELHG